MVKFKLKFNASCPLIAAIVGAKSQHLKSNNKKARSLNSKQQIPQNYQAGRYTISRPIQKNTEYRQWQKVGKVMS